MTPLADRLARVRLSPAQLQTALAACVALSLAALIGVVWLVLTRADIARAEARRAVQEAAAVRAEADAADCALIDVLRVHPGDPPRVTRGGQLMAERVEAAYRARRCTE